MPLFSYGPVTVSTAMVQTDASLEQLRDAMVARKPDAKDLKTGWGSIGDEVDLIRKAGAPQPMAGTAALKAEGEGLPARLEARCYWWEVEAPLLRYPGIESRQAMKLEAADIVISQSSDNEYVVLISTRIDSQLKTSVKPLLDDLLESSGGGSISYDSLPPGMSDSNSFFLWLIKRGLLQAQLGDDLVITSVSSARAEDGGSRVSSLSKGVAIDRAELLALAMRDGVSFGPVKVGLSDSTLGLQIMVEIATHGAFTITKREVKFQAPPDGVETGYLYLLASLYFVYRIFPKMTSVFHEDKEWGQEGIAAFRSYCRDLIRSVLDQS